MKGVKKFSEFPSAQAAPSRAAEVAAESSSLKAGNALLRRSVPMVDSAASTAAAATSSDDAEKSEAQQQQQSSEDEDDDDEFNPFRFIKGLPVLGPDVINRKSPLPKYHGKLPCLVLDLDETLVHCSVQPIDNPSHTFSVLVSGQSYNVYVRTRPHLKTFLEQVAQWFEVIIFTASQQVYADKLLDILDPKHHYIKHRLFRDSCVCVDGNYLKDLHIVGRPLPRLAIVDNSIQAFGFQVENGIPIESWYEDETDRELLNLLPFLEKMKSLPDVRPLIRETFKLQEHIDAVKL